MSRYIQILYRTAPVLVLVLYTCAREQVETREHNSQAVLVGTYTLYPTYQYLYIVHTAYLYTSTLL